MGLRRDGDVHALAVLGGARDRRGPGGCNVQVHLPVMLRSSGAGKFWRCVFRNDVGEIGVRCLVSEDCTFELAKSADFKPKRIHRVLNTET